MMNNRLLLADKEEMFGAYHSFSIVVVDHDCE